MKVKSNLIRLFLVVTLSLINTLMISGCGVGRLFDPSPTPSPTATPILISTNTPTFTPSPTLTSTPTDTPTPTLMPTGTPAPLGVVASNELWEVTLIGVVVRERIYPGEQTLYRPKAGYMIIDIGVRVRYIPQPNTSIMGDDVLVILENKEIENVAWAGVVFDAADKDIDPLHLSISDTLTDVKGLTYFRLIYVIPELPEQTLLFSFQPDAPLIVFTVKALE